MTQGWGNDRRPAVRRDRRALLLARRRHVGLCRMRLGPIIVLMWLGSKGVFLDVDDLTEDGPSSLPERELLLRNVVFYSIAAFVGIYAWWRLRGQRLVRRDMDR
jgi:hypothetical protein